MIFHLAAAALLAGSSPPPAGTVTEATRAANAQVEARLPLGDRQDFEDARRGKIAEIEDGIIRGPDGETVWDAESFGFLQAAAPASVNPSLWRQSQLLAEHGLFEVRTAYTRSAATTLPT